jgi:hypothetical protein
MARKRPTVLTVMGVLNIVFGGLGLACYLCVGLGLVLLFASVGGAGGAFPGGINPIADMWDFMKRDVPGFAAISIGQILLSFVMSIILVVAGIGLLIMKPWGRVLSICYSIVTILAQIGALVFQLAIVNPATQRWAQDFVRRHGGVAGGNGDIGNTAMSNLQTVGGAVIGMTYSIVLLVMMLLPSVSAAFSARGPMDEHDRYRQEDEDDDDLGRERRRPDEWRE